MQLPTPDTISDRPQTPLFPLRLPRLILCLFSLFFLFSCADTSPKSRMEKRVSIYLDRLESSAVDLEHELGKIADMKRINTAARMKEAVSIIENSEKTLKKANQDVAAYIAFVNTNSRELSQENLDPYIRIRDLLNHGLTLKRQAMDDYFQETKKWLTYSADHFTQLEAKNQGARASYDALLINVNRSLKQYDTANEQYHQFVADFLAQNPTLAKRFKQKYKTMKKELGWL